MLDISEATRIPIAHQSSVFHGIAPPPCFIYPVRASIRFFEINGTMILAP